MSHLDFNLNVRTVQTILLAAQLIMYSVFVAADPAHLG